MRIECNKCIKGGLLDNYQTFHGKEFRDTLLNVIELSFSFFRDGK